MPGHVERDNAKPFGDRSIRHHVPELAAVGARRMQANQGNSRAAFLEIDPLRSPGLLDRHYAPSRPLRLDATSLRPDEALLAFGPAAPEGAQERLNLSETGDLTEAAANLFAFLHRLDRSGASAIAVMPIPERGLGIAINDRLRRAAAPK